MQRRTRLCRALQLRRISGQFIHCHIGQVYRVKLPSTYQLTVQTERLMNVTLCGPKGAIETLTPEQVVIEIDAEDFSVATGEQNIACRLYVPSNGKIFALGSYVLQCRIESN